MHLNRYGRFAVVEVAQHGVPHHVYQLVPIVALSKDAVTYGASLVAPSGDSRTWKTISVSGIATNPLYLPVPIIRSYSAWGPIQNHTKSSPSCTATAR